MGSKRPRWRPADAKFARPRPERASIRTDTVGAYKTGAGRRLTLVSAPAGYGKTTITAAALAQLAPKAVWYKLDVLDKDPIVFLAGLIGGMRRASSGFAETLLRELEARSAPDLTATQLAALFVSECETRLVGQTCVVLDDYHEAVESGELNALLSYVLDNAPPTLRLVVLTRYEPGFDVHKLHLDGHVMRIGGDLLRFDETQVACVLRERSGRDLSDAEVRGLLRVTEGWPASVVLASMALAWLDPTSLKGDLADPRLQTDVYSYLAEQVFLRESDAVRRFLLRTSCLDLITTELATRLLPDDEAHPLLQHLATHQVFTFAADNEGSYRYHPLFRDFLQQHVVQDNGPDALAALQLETADALEASGESRRAIELLLGANQPSRALDVVARAGEAGLDRCPTDQLHSWLVRVRPALAADHPWALVLAGAVNAREGRFDAALSALQHAVDSLERTGENRSVYESLSLTESTQFWAGDPEACAETCHRALHHAETKAQRLHTLLSLLSAGVDMRRWQDVESASREAEELLPYAESDEVGRAQGLRAHAAYFQGDMRRALDVVNHCPAQSQTVALRAAVLNTRGMIEMALGEYTAARRSLRAAESITDTYGHAMTSYMIKDNLAFLLASEGHTSTGLSKLGALRRDPGYVREPSLFCCVLSHESTVLRRSNRIAESLEPSRLAVDGVLFSRDPYLALNARANLAFSEGLLGASRHQGLCNTARQATEAGLRFVALKAQLYAAILEFAHDRQAALEELEACLPLQLELGHLHLISQELCPRPDVAVSVLRRNRSNRLGPRLIEALSRHWQFDQTAQILRRDCPSEVGTWIDRIRTRPQMPSRVGTIWPEPQASRGVADQDGTSLSQITKREREVLDAMARGLTNDQIAEALFLAMPTVKSHISRIYRKLGQKDRVGAVLAYQRLLAMLDDAT